MYKRQALIWLLTRNVTQALAVLMVDFSCALKLSMPIAVLSAMKEATGYHLSVKGGRFLEAVSEADTIVFDKTGTLTRAEPKVAQIVTFGENSEADMLRPVSYTHLDVYKRQATSLSVIVSRSGASSAG